MSALSAARNRNIGQSTRRQEMGNEASYSELQRRLAVVEERNRANTEKRKELERKAKDQFGVSSVDELSILIQKLEKERDEKVAERDRLLQEAEVMLTELEERLGIR